MIGQEKGRQSKEYLQEPGGAMTTTCRLQLPASVEVDTTMPCECQQLFVGL